MSSFIGTKVIKTQLFCTFTLGLYFLEQENWSKSCTKNVVEIDYLWDMMKTCKIYKLPKNT
jgi:hypothetical protein